MKSVLLIMKSESYKAHDFISAARKLGIDLIVGSDQESVLDDFGGDFADNFGKERTLHLNFAKLEDSARRIAEFHLRRSFDAVVAVEDEGTALAARASVRLGLARNPEESVVASLNKAVMREVLAAQQVDGPWFRLISLSDDPGKIAGEVDFPCVLKPLFLSASRGVIRANDVGEFVDAFARIRGILDDPDLRARGGEMAGQLLVEGFMAGAEVAIEGMLNEGKLSVLAFFDKPDAMDGPYFEETIFVTPSRHSAEVQARAVEMAKRSLRALGLRTGPVHVEMRIDAGQPRLLEVAPRTIGGHCARVLNFAAGMTLEELVLRQALGIAPDEMQREREAAGVMMIPIPRGGILRRVDGLEAARAIPNIWEIEISIPLTQRVTPLPEGYRYLGFIFARGESPGAVEGALRDAHSLLRFTIE